MSFRQSVNFVPHEQVDWRVFDPTLQRITNFMHVSNKPEEQWIVETTRAIGDWRSLVRTTFMRTILAIDALEAAATACAAKPEEPISINTLRPSHWGAKEVILHSWTGAEAAGNHRHTAALLPAYGITDLVGAWEEITLSMYRIFLTHHPQLLMTGDHKQMRRLYYDRNKDKAAEEAWSSAWTSRLEGWARSKTHDGLAKVFRAYVEHAKLKTPTWHRHVTVTDWIMTLDGFAELRNSITHGAHTVSARLASAFNRPGAMSIVFTSGDPLHIERRHLQLLECFFDQLLSGLNLSLLERARGPLPHPKRR
ncbi:hypothetical protein [Azospirillum sp. SYSU D00513]|uniref:hypothetical protein n=1 Tax=Azospirillum sp. SYSU D00513 TaxID=2812561 RepID=UPI001A96C105|nr:hypothetical protein [Azospirillum sp. SYSU D00513]